MATRGRPPTATPDLKLRGTFREDRHGERPDSSSPAGAPPAPPILPPADLKGEALAYWNSILPELTAKGMVGPLDLAALVAVSDLWAKYRKASRKADRRPADKNARIAVVNYYAMFERASARVGLSPVDRGRIKAAKSGEQEPIDPLERAFRKREQRA